LRHPVLTEFLYSGRPLVGKPGNVRDTDVREMSGISLKVMEMSGNCQGKNLVMENCVIFIISHYSVAVDDTGFYDVIIIKSLSLNMNLTV